MVARFPFNKPALARLKPAVHKPPIKGPFRASRRSQLSKRLVVVFLILMPPQTMTVSSR